VIAGSHAERGPKASATPPADALESGRSTPPRVASATLFTRFGKGSRDTCSTGRCRLNCRTSSIAWAATSVTSPLNTATPPAASANRLLCSIAANDTPSFGNRNREAKSCRTSVPAPTDAESNP
jgi:hypothetical protein